MTRFLHRAITIPLLGTGFMNAFGLLSGCTTPEEGTGTDAPRQATWESELMAADRAFNDATARLGTEGWVGFFAPDGAMISQGVGEIRGPEAIRARMEAAFSDSSLRLTWEPLRAEVSRSGDLGFTVGRWESVRGDTAGAESWTQGLYVSIWRRQTDGSWKVVMDLGNPTEPPG